MYLKYAQQIAELLNDRNQLTIKYDADRVTKEWNHYVYRIVNDEVAGCVEVKPVQWYQAEILHLTVSEKHEGKGMAKELLSAALIRAKDQGKRIAQCTIREGNQRSESLFAKFGFVRVGCFLNPPSGNNVGVWQRIIVPAADDHS